MVQKVVGSIPISHPILYVLAGIVQWLVCKFSKLEMRVRFSLPAPSLKRLFFEMIKKESVASSKGALFHSILLYYHNSSLKSITL